MAEAQQVIIEFIAETGQLDSAIDQLEKTGAIDSKLAQEFKKNSAEINKQATEIKKAAATIAPLKKNLEDINKTTKNLAQEFMTGCSPYAFILEHSRSLKDAFPLRVMTWARAVVFP